MLLITVPFKNSNSAFCFSIYRHVLHFCMCNFVSGNTANCALFPETKLHIQKYDGLENMGGPSRGLDVTRGSCTDTNLGHNHTKI